MMKKNYINDVNNDYERCLFLNKILQILFYLSIVLSFTLCFKYIEIICITLIILHLAHFIIGITNDLFLFNKAEYERRKTNLANAFNTNLTEKKTKNYYNNKEKHTIKKYFVNTFESVFFTKNNLNKGLLWESLKTLIEIVIWLIIILNVSDKNIVLSITQTIFSAEILESYIKYLYYLSKANRIYDDFYCNLITKSYLEESIPVLLNCCIDYECLKASTHILLSKKIFDNNNSTWSNEWNIQKKKIK